MNKNNQIHTEECYVASIDLLGMKDIIKKDTDDIRLNQIRNIYKSWPGIIKDSYFQDMKIRFFSDNFVLALRTDNYGAADKILETVAWICAHFIRRGYKPRGGICKGNFYVDDIFVWGDGLVEAYLIESKKAFYPRIVVSDDVLKNASEHLKNWMIFEEDDCKCLNYLKAYGGNRSDWLEDIKEIEEWLYAELDNALNIIKSGKASAEDLKIYNKLNWLWQFVEKNKLFWEQFKN